MAGKRQRDPIVAPRQVVPGLGNSLANYRSTTRQRHRVGIGDSAELADAGDSLSFIVRHTSGQTERWKGLAGQRVSRRIRQPAFSKSRRAMREAGNHEGERAEEMDDAG